MSYREALHFFELNELYTKKELDDSYYRLLKEKPIESIDLMYSILLNELNKRVLKDSTAEFQENITKLKEKYKNTKIVYLCNSFENRLKYIKSMAELDSSRNDFNTRIGILKSQIIVPNEKLKINEELKKYLIGSSDKLKSIVLDYIENINNTTTLEEINNVKQKYQKMLDEELKQEKLRAKELDNLKISLKKSLIYNFYTLSKSLNIQEIINAHNLLLNILELTSFINFENKEFLLNLINEIDYNDVNESFHKIDLYLKSNNIKLESFDNKLVFLSEHNISHEFIDMVLDKYYLYATKKKESIDKLIKDKDNFKELLILINNSNENLLNKILNYSDNLSYKNIKILMEGVEDFNTLKNIFIERTTGNLCVFKNTPKKIYTIFLNGEIENDLTNENDIKWKYISLLKFFNFAEYSDGFEINQVTKTEEIPLGDYNTNYLYYTNELLLCLIDDGETKKFKFIPNLDDSKFIKGENTQITRNDYFEYYKDKNKCIDDLISSITSKYESKIQKSI